MAIRGTLSIKKAKKMINYNPKYGIANGFEKYYQWYKNFYGTKELNQNNQNHNKKEILSASVVKKTLV